MIELALIILACTMSSSTPPTSQAANSASRGGATNAADASTVQTAKTLPEDPSPPAVEKHNQDGSRPAPAGLLTPIPEEGNLPPILGALEAASANQLKKRAEVRGYAQQIRHLKRKYFGDIKVEEIRAQGIAQIEEFIDPAAFSPLIEELRHERDDVRLALLDHLAGRGNEGQAALAFVAITDRDAAIRHEAMSRLTTPPSPPVLSVLDMGLRSDKDFVANMSAQLAGTLNVINAIPQLIMAQVVAPPPDQPAGDLAWIAIETQRTYVAGLTPVQGDNSGAFQPTIGVVSDGSVLRIVDAVVISYRTEVHNVLVAMTSNDWGQPTEYLGYNIDAWWHWYNEEYMPFKNAQIEQGAGTAAAAQVKPPPQAQPAK